LNPEQGDLAPDFTLPADDGSEVRLSGLRGRRVVLFFYPRADTPGCTTEACEFRDLHPRFEERDAVVLGISPDPVEEVRKFRDKFGFPYRLLADADHRVAEEYGVWKEKSMYGKLYWGVERSTFVIDEQGRIASAHRKVKPEGHAEAVLEGM
jgi:peroxiredoxin Q/BCP